MEKKNINEPIEDADKLMKDLGQIIPFFAGGLVLFAFGGEFGPLMGTVQLLGLGFTAVGLWRLAGVMYKDVIKGRKGKMQMETDKNKQCAVKETEQTNVLDKNKNKKVKIIISDPQRDIRSKLTRYQNRFKKLNTEQESAPDKIGNKKVKIRIIEAQGDSGDILTKYQNRLKKFNSVQPKVSEPEPDIETMEETKVKTR